MALPTTLSGLDTAVATIGPFKSSAGSYYVLGKSSGGSDFNKVRALKASDPSVSFSDLGLSPAFDASANINSLAAFQVGDVIHIAAHTGDGAGAFRDVVYETFDMSTDSWGTVETIQANFDPSTSGVVAQTGVSIVVRSDSTVVVLYNGPRVASMGNSYSRVVYARRAAGGGWTTNVAVDAGGAADGTLPEAVLGSSDRSHFFWADTSSGLGHRALTSANALQTASTIGIVTNSHQGISYVDGGSTRVALARRGSTTTTTRFVYFDSANTPTLNTGADNSGASPGTTSNYRAFVDGTDLYFVFKGVTQSDLYIALSTDAGATLGAHSVIFSGTVAAGEESLSKDGAVYQRGSDYVIPYVVNDNGTLKYNEYVVRSSGTTTQKAISVTTGQSVTVLDTYGKTIKPTLAQVVSMLRATNKNFPLSQTPTVAVVKVIGKQPFSLQQGQSISFFKFKAINKIVSVAHGQVASLFRFAGKLISVTQVQAVTVRVAVSRIVTLTQTQSLAVRRAISHAISIAAQGMSVLLLRQTGKLVLAGGPGQSVVLRRQTGKLVGVQQPEVVTTRQATGHAVPVQTGQSVSLLRLVGKRIVAAVSQVVTSTTQFVAGGGGTTQKVISATQSQSVALQVAVGKIISLAQAQSATVLKRVAKKVSVTQAQAASLLRQASKLILVTSGQGGGVGSGTWQTAFSTTNNLSATAQDGINHRQYFAAAALAAISGTKVRITVDTQGLSDCGFSGMTMGHRTSGDQYDIDGTPTQVTRGSVVAWVADTNALSVTDEIDFNFTSGLDFVVAFHVNGGSGHDAIRANQSVANATNYRKTAASEVTVGDVSSYLTSSTGVRGVQKIEVFVPSGGVQLFKSVGKRVVVAQSQVASVIRSTLKLIAVLSPQSVQVFARKAAAKVVSVTQGQSVLVFVRKAAAKVISASQSQAVTLIRRTSKIVSVAQAQLVTMRVRVNKIIVLTKAQSVQVFNGGVRVNNKLVNVSQDQLVTLMVRVGKIISLTQAQAVTLSRAVQKRMTLVQGQSVSVVRSKALNRIVSVTQTQAVTLRRQIGKLVQVLQSHVVTTRVNVRKIVVATQSQIVTVFNGFTQTVQKAIVVTQTQSVSLLKVVGKKITVAQTQVVAVLRARFLLRLVSVTQAHVVAVRRSTAKLVGVVQDHAVTLRRSIGKRIALSQSPAVLLYKAAQKRVTLTQAQSVSVSRVRGKLIVAPIGQLVSLFQTFVAGNFVQSLVCAAIEIYSALTGRANMMTAVDAEASVGPAVGGSASVGPAVDGSAEVTSGVSGSAEVYPAVDGQPDTRKC